ncbi:MAG: aldolase/citrate lyase family protein [Actinomycetota bacterium]
MSSLSEFLSDDGTAFGGWLSVPNSVSAEHVSRLGFDYVCIDTQHGFVEYSATVGMIQGILLGGSVPLVRVPWNEPGIIGKMLDAGAHGVIVPMVNTVADAEAAVAAGRYAPDGSRSYGPTATATRPDVPYVDWAREQTTVIPMIETVEAIANLDDILAVPGIEAIYVGPADLSLTLGLPPANNDDEPAFTEALEAIVAGCHRAGVAPGIHASGALAERRVEQGFRVITVANDVLAIRGAMSAELATARGASSSTAAESGPY